LSNRGREDRIHPDYVVVGEGKGLDYDSLTAGINLLLCSGAKLIGTNPDVNLDGTLDGRPVILPGGGALIAPFQVATSIEPLFIGKPNLIIFRMGLRRLGLEAGSIFMIGDRPDTDIQGAARIGMRTILVTTGRFKRGDPYPPDIPSPDITLDSLAELDLGRLETMAQG
jgi:ribonucleotide monophosphatase NagD (HAD superfamily)